MLIIHNFSFPILILIIRPNKFYIRQYVDEKKKTSVIEFTLKLSSNNVKGADIINWGPDGKMSSIRAYVY